MDKGLNDGRTFGKNGARLFVAAVKTAEGGAAPDVFAEPNIVKMAMLARSVVIPRSSE